MSVKIRKVSTGDSYIDITRIAKELGIDYAGLSRQELVRQINKKIGEMDEVADTLTSVPLNDEDYEVLHNIKDIKSKLEDCIESIKNRNGLDDMQEVFLRYHNII